MKYSAFWSVLAGAIATFSFAPFDIWIAALLSPAIAYVLIPTHSYKQALWIGWCYGVGFFGAGVSWVWVSIHEYGFAPVWLASLLTAVFVMGLALLFALQAGLYAKLASGWIAKAWMFILLWFIFEWLRSWFLTGFPWLYLGYTWIGTPLQVLAPVWGVWGLSLFTLCLAIGTTLLLRCYFSKTKRPSWTRKQSLLCVSPLLCAAVLLMSAVFFHANMSLEAAEEPVEVALVQPNIPLLDKFRPDLFQQQIEHLIQLSEAHQEADIILWPETAIPDFYARAERYLSPFQQRLEAVNTTLISGFPSVVFDQQTQRTLYHNSLGVFSHGEGVYHKRRLVPFGEYVPFEKHLRGLIAFFDLPMSQFSLPESGDLHLRVGALRIASLICYEVAYPELTRISARDSDFLMTVSNDTWFGDSLAAPQHLQLAQMRAIENGRWMIRSTNDGLTAIINPQGVILQQLSREHPGVLRGAIEAIEGQTPYQRWGVWPTLIFVLGLLSIILLRNRFSSMAEKP